MTGAFRYAVVDLASAKSLRTVVPRLLSAVSEPLLDRSMPLHLLQVGPWLVLLDDAPEVDRTLAAYGPQIPWGYYLHAQVDLLSLRQSLRKFNLAQLPDRPKPVLFRYWDPRVLRLFLDRTTSAQRGQFMAWIDSIVWPDGQMIHQSQPELDT
jgi:hypothetical protein